MAAIERLAPVPAPDAAYYLDRQARRESNARTYARKLQLAIVRAKGLTPTQGWWDAELVAREKLNEEDGRAVTVTLTQIGRDDWRTASVVYYRLVKRVFTNHLTETDVIAMHRVFGKVLEG